MRRQLNKHGAKVMKTQISSLINGSKNVKRDSNNEKYLTAKQATSHNDYAGTGRKLRASIAMAVNSENKESMKVSLFGETLTLTCNYSTTGKTFTYNTDITEEQYKLFGGWCTDGNIKSYGLHINGDMTVELLSYTKKNEASQWRLSQYTYIDESFVTIL